MKPDLLREQIEYFGLEVFITLETTFFTAWFIQQTQPNNRFVKEFNKLLIDNWLREQQLFIAFK